MKLTRRRALALAALGGGAVLAPPAAWWYSAGFEPRWLQVTRLRVPLARLPRAFAGVTIAQISDLHLGPLVPAAAVRAAVDLVLALRPDIAVVTGDFVSRLDRGEAESIVREMDRLRAPLGAFASLGNHDHWTNAATVADAVARSGLTLVRNASAPVRRGGETLHVAGVDDVWENKHDLATALRGVPRDGCAVLLAHEPDFADHAATDGRVALQLSGHSHGGQVRLPGRGALVLPPHGRMYPEGLRRVGAMALYTNRGVGVIAPPVRVNCRPEVTLLELTPA